MALAMAVRGLSSSMDKPIKRLQNDGSLYCMLNAPLEVIADLIELKKARQWKGLNSFFRRISLLSP